ncbi:alpha/beta hydrolase [Methanobrevibacter sp.]
MKKKIILALMALFIIAIIAYGTYYVNDYYHADENAMKYINGTDNVEVIKTDKGLFLDGPGNDTALIFYPGAKVEYTSYLPLLTKISEKNIDCFLVEMPFNLAIFDISAADNIMNNYNYTHYYMSGHSLGGSIASQYLQDTGNGDGLILFAAYPTDEIAKPVLSIYGSEDKVLNMEKYNESKAFMKNLTEIKIKGANHAQVGDYGIQEGDGTAKLSPAQQQEKSSNEVIKFIEKTQ